MFVGATKDISMMPPKCCTLLQIHTVLGYLTFDQAKAYRAKFEEWITAVKVYCPSPTCSAFISEQRVPAIGEAATTTRPSPSLSSILGEVLANVIKTPPSRFFRGEMDITQLAGYATVVKRPMHLGIIQDQLATSRYKSVDDLTKDMRQIWTNAKEYNGELHPVATAAEQMFGAYLLEISTAMGRLISAAAAPLPVPLFTCPKCHIGICTTCKQIEHAGSPCDTSIADHEIAMLQTFGYKRCPRCKAGVKKMFGCSHMQCVCGAHWCYWCQRSLEECDGTCDGREDDDEDEDDYDSELDEEALEEREGHEAHPQGPPQRPPPPAPRDRDHTLNPIRPPTDTRIVNLDAGGLRRWAEENVDFGEEPEDEPFAQVWSCHHSFETYKTPPDDGINRGDLDRMECNRCFERVEAVRPPSKIMPPKKRRRPITQAGRKDLATVLDEVLVVGETERAGWECTKCRVLVCVSCKNKYQADQRKRS